MNQIIFSMTYGKFDIGSKIFSVGETSSMV